MKLRVPSTLESRRLRRSAAHDMVLLAIVVVYVYAGLTAIATSLLVLHAWSLPFRRWMWRR